MDIENSVCRVGCGLVSGIRWGLWNIFPARICLEVSVCSLDFKEHDEWYSHSSIKNKD